MSEKKLCLRCGHNWWTKNSGTTPKVCPNCKSKKWNSLKRWNDRGPKRIKLPGDKNGKKAKFKKTISNL